MTQPERYAEGPDRGASPDARVDAIVHEYRTRRAETGGAIGPAARGAAIHPDPGSGPVPAAGPLPEGTESPETSARERTLDRALEAAASAHRQLQERLSDHGAQPSGARPPIPRAPAG